VGGKHLNIKEPCNLVDWNVYLSMSPRKKLTVMRAADRKDPQRQGIWTLTFCTGTLIPMEEKVMRFLGVFSMQ
jgi:hypothetical protein